MQLKKAVFLDRDGTVIKDMIYLNDPGQIMVFPESYPALKHLVQNDYLIVLATNQSGVARGFVDEKNLKKINELLIAEFKGHEIPIEEVYYCPHPVDGGCRCRKPNPGMLESASKKYGIDLSLSWMVGDRMSDVETGRRAKCRGSILLQNETTPDIDPQYAKAEIVCHDVLEAARFIVENSAGPQ